MKQRQVLLIFVSFMLVCASGTDWLVVEGHSGSHVGAMGTFGPDGQKSFGFDRYVQVDSAGQRAPPTESYFLYRGGDPGRWIITKGEAGINQKQGVLISEEEDRGSAVGTKWLAAEDGQWKPDPNIVVRVQAPPSLDNPNVGESADQNCEEVERRALSAESRGEALESDLSTMTMRATKLEQRAKEAEAARDGVVAEFEQQRSALEEDLKAKTAELDDQSRSIVNLEVAVAQLTQEKEALAEKLQAEKEERRSEHDTERGQEEGSKSGRLVGERPPRLLRGGGGEDVWAGLSEVAEFLLGQLLARGVPVPPDVSAMQIAAAALALTVLASALALLLLFKLVACACCRGGGGGKRTSSAGKRGMGGGAGDDSGEDSDFEARMAAAERANVELSGELPARFRSSQAGFGPRPGGITVDGPGNKTSDGRVAKRTSATHKGNHGD